MKEKRGSERQHFLKKDTDAAGGGDEDEKRKGKQVGSGRRRRAKHLSVQEFNTYAAPPSSSSPFSPCSTSFPPASPPASHLSLLSRRGEGDRQCTDVSFQASLSSPSWRIRLRRRRPRSCTLREAPSVPSSSAYLVLLTA